MRPNAEDGRDALIPIPRQFPRSVSAASAAGPPQGFCPAGSATQRPALWVPSAGQGRAVRFTRVQCSGSCFGHIVIKCESNVNLMSIQKSLFRHSQQFEFLHHSFCTSYSINTRQNIHFRWFCATVHFVSGYKIFLRNVCSYLFL